VTRFCFRWKGSKIRSPSPQRGSGARGEGGERTVEMSAAVRGPSSSNGFGELIHLRGIPLTPKSLSRVGERGADLLRLCAGQISTQKCHYNLQSSIIGDAQS
jgi:hypothetical protein